MQNRAKAAILRRDMAALEIKGVSKHFGAILALDDVSLTLGGGEVIGLMGDNGAGKSTLVKIIAGNFRPSQGKLLINGNEVTFHRPIEARWHARCAALLGFATEALDAPAVQTAAWMQLRKDGPR